MQASVPSPSRLPTGRLRVLETTDLHMQLLDYDYFADVTDPGIGLIGLIDQIEAFRNEKGVTTLLCDNGDTIQGNPLADHLARHLGPDQTHPMIAAFNLMEYDAMTLGNHEFDYGLRFLRNILSKAKFPIISANIACRDGEALARPFDILERDIPCDDGQRRPIRIGITGFGPPQIEDWGDPFGDGAVRADDIVDAAQEVIPQMRAAGADLIIALCHSGIGASERSPRMENAALPLAMTDGIDVLLLGHTHEAFPDPEGTNTSPADDRNGRLHGKPAVMARFCGKSLGVIDLDLQWEKGAWSIAGHKTRLIHARPSQGHQNPLGRKLRDLVAAPHAETLAKLRAPIARTDLPIVSYFATVQPDLSQQLLARAMQKALSKAIAHTGDAALPILAAKSSYRFGGRSGPGQFIDIPPGPITLRDAAAIFPFSDTLYGVRRTGKQLRVWLERSAAHYNQIQPGDTDRPLIHPQSAGYNCDAIFGLTYQIDLTQPARFDTQGNVVAPNAQRIVQLAHNNLPVRDEDRFIVATNSFRAKGGGGFPAIAPTDVLHRSTQSVRAHLITYLAEVGTVKTPLRPSWSFAPAAGATAVFDSAPQARDHLDHPLSHIGPGKDGFARYRISF